MLLSLMLLTLPARADFGLQMAVLERGSEGLAVRIEYPSLSGLPEQASDNVYRFAEGMAEGLSPRIRKTLLRAD